MNILYLQCYLIDRMLASGDYIGCGYDAKYFDIIKVLINLFLFRIKIVYYQK